MHGDWRQSEDKSNNGNWVRSTGIDRGVLQSETREYNEREKRKSFVSLRRFPCTNANEVQGVIDEICQALDIDRVSLHSVQTLNTRGLFRAKIENYVGRRILLVNAKKLKNSSKFRSTYINRDLTYQQRKHLKERRRGGVEEFNVESEIQRKLNMPTRVEGKREWTVGDL